MKKIILSRSEQVIKSEIEGIEQELKYHEVTEAVEGRRSMAHNLLIGQLNRLELQLKRA